MSDFFRRLCCCFFTQSDYEFIPEPSSESLDPINYLRQSSYLPRYTQTLYRPLFPDYRGVPPRSSWEPDPNKVNAFRAWQAQSIDLPPTAPVDLQKLTGLTYYENQKPTSDIPPVSIYLAPEVTAPWDKSGILILNFNMTITKHHTCTPLDDHNETYRGYIISAAARLNNIRHLQQLCDVLLHAKKNRVAVAIVTRDPDITNILAYLQTLAAQINPDSTISDYISIVLCSFTFMTEAFCKPGLYPQKAGEVSFVSELLLRNYRAAPKIPVMFIDPSVDTNRFMSQMRHDSTSTKQARNITLRFNKSTEARGEDGSDQHLIDAQAFITSCSTGSPHQRPTVGASTSYTS